MVFSYAKKQIIFATAQETCNRFYMVDKVIGESLEYQGRQSATKSCRACACGLSKSPDPENVMVEHSVCRTPRD
jgi:hypothetical protein